MKSAGWIPSSELCCRKCGAFGLGYMLVDKVWLAANDDCLDGLLCLPCVEAELGRPLRRSDFARVRLNEPIFYVFDLFKRRR